MEGSPWRVVRGVVRRVIRGAGSVGSPRIGGQSFPLLKKRSNNRPEQKSRGCFTAYIYL